MKNFVFKSWLSLSLISLLFTGCDLFDKADDVTFETDLTVNWTVDETQDFTNKAYEHSELIDLTTNPEISKYANKIKDVKVTKITYKIENYDAAPHNTAVTFNNGVATFTVVGSSSPVVSAPYTASASGVNLQTTTAETELAFNSDHLNKLAGVFKEYKKAVITSTGTLSKTPVSFKVVTKYYVTITANALD